MALTEGDGVLNDPLGFTVEDEAAEVEQRWISIDANVFDALRVAIWTRRGRTERIVSVRNPHAANGRSMKQNVDFSKAKRGAAAVPRGKTRITIYLDDAVIEHFRTVSERTGKGYQTLINDALTSQMADVERPLTANTMRKILREELAQRAGA